MIYLGCIGGRDIKDATRKILHNLFSTGLARKLNFSGNGEKQAINNTAIRRVIIGK